RERGLPPRSCGAVGDSRSDLPLFASVGLSVAFNASAGARGAATVAVDDDDLRGVLPVLSRLVTATRRRPTADGRGLTTDNRQPVTEVVRGVDLIAPASPTGPAPH